MGNPWVFESCEASLVNPRETLCYDPHTQTTHPTILRTPDTAARRSSGYLLTCYDTIVIEVTAMVNAGTTCSMAVSFGPRSRFNKRGVKDGCDLRSGLCFVVYEGLVLALKAKRQTTHPVGRVLVMLDQKWFVKALTSGRAFPPTPQSMIMGHIQKVIYEAAQQGLDVSTFLQREERC
jgi:hypothetical protein